LRTGKPGPWISALRILWGKGAVVYGEKSLLHDGGKPYQAGLTV